MPHPSVKPRRLLCAVLMSSVLLLAACGGDDGDEAGSTPEGDVAAFPAPTGSDGDDSDGGGEDPETSEEAAVCDLLSDEEVTDLTGYEVLNTEANTMQLHTCTWELSVPAEDQTTGIPELSIVVLPEADYRSRTEHPALSDVDGVGDEAKFRIAGGAGGVPAMVNFWALQGDQGVHILPGFEIWSDETSAKEALSDMGRLILDRL